MGARGARRRALPPLPWATARPVGHVGQVCAPGGGQATGKGRGCPVLPGSAVPELRPSLVSVVCPLVQARPRLCGAGARSSSYVELISDPHHFFCQGQRGGMQGPRRCPQVSEGVFGHPPALPGGTRGCRAGTAAPRAETLTAGLGHHWARVDALCECLLPPPGAWCSHGTSSPSARCTRQAAGLSPGSARVTVRWLAQGLHQQLLLLSPGRETRVAGVQADAHTDELGSDPGKKPVLCL